MKGRTSPRGGLGPNRMSDPPATVVSMKPKQQDLPLKWWGGARRGAGRKRKGPRKKVLQPDAPAIPAWRPACHGETADGRLEPAHAPLLSSVAARFCRRVRAVRLPPGAFLGSGQPRAHDRGGARRRFAGPRHERARGPHGARAEQGDAPPRGSVRGALSFVVHAAPGEAEVETSLVYAGKPVRRAQSQVRFTKDEPARVRVE
jgi:hypothetical protein